MVFGYFIATGIETLIELGFWSIRKVGSLVYYSYYGEEEEEKNGIQMTEEEINTKNEEIIDNQEESDALDALQEMNDNYDEEGEEIIEFNESDGYIGLNAINMDFKFDVE